MILALLLIAPALTSPTLEASLSIPVQDSQPIQWPSSLYGSAQIWSDDSFYNEIKRTNFKTLTTTIETTFQDAYGYLAGNFHFNQFSCVIHPINPEQVVDVTNLAGNPSKQLDSLATTFMNDLLKTGFYFENFEADSLNSTQIQALLDIDSVKYVGDTTGFGRVNVKLSGPGYVLPRLLKSNKMVIILEGVQEIWKRSDGAVVLRVDGYGKIASILNLKSLKGTLQLTGGSPYFTGASSSSNTKNIAATNTGNSKLRIAGIVIGSILLAGILIAFILILKNYKK